MNVLTLLAIKVLVLLTTATFVLSQAHATTRRSNSVKLAFVHANACPATGLYKLPCKGWIIDHRIALCAGGADRPENLQWQTIADAKAKDRWECKK